jgi:hypothetical protein
MPRIIDAMGNEYSGYPKINLDKVATFEPSKGKYGPFYRCYDEEGTELGVVSETELEHAIKEALPIVPNNTGIRLVIISMDMDEIMPPVVERLPIIAWRIDGMGANPVIHENTPDDYWALEIPAPDGSLYAVPFLTVFRSLEDLIEYFQEQYREENKRKAAKQATQKQEASE